MANATRSAGVDIPSDPDRLATSYLNEVGEIRDEVRASSVFLCDVTLREGEQAAGANFTRAEKVLLAGMLADAGVKQIQVGYPGMSTEEKETVKLLVRQGFPAEIESISMIHVSDWQQHIDAAIECEVDVLSMQHGVSDLRLREVIQKSEDEVLELILRSLRYAKERGARVVSFSPTDATRTNLPFLLRVYRELERGGADRVRLTDSVGGIGPTAFRYLVREIKKVISIPLGVHVHNDFGLAMANVVAAVEAGADFVDVSVNGLGDRAGNASLDEVAMTLRYIYGMGLPIRPSRLMGLAREVADMTRIPIPPSKPIVGENCFSHQLDLHVMSVMKWPHMYEPFPPELVGGMRRFPLGRMSGPHAVRWHLRSLGISEDEVDMDRLVAAVRRLAEERKRPVTDDELLESLSEIRNRPARADL